MRYGLPKGILTCSFKIMSVNVNGVLYTAQAAGRHMEKFGTPGSIILIASMSGSITNRVINNYHSGNTFV